MVYANSLKKRLQENPNISVFLINTGWNGQGKRMSLKETRAMVTAAVEGQLDHVEYSTHPIFKIAIPKQCPGLPDQNVLDPLNSWTDQNLYWQKANELAQSFQENIKKFPALTEEVLEAGPTPIPELAYTLQA
jgi:phosphoenolpyruvate carboxykinase (ATP)